VRAEPECETGSSNRCPLNPQGYNAGLTNVQTQVGLGVNIIYYGGAGDGVTDNMPALTAALAASNTVIFPAGSFLFRTAFSLTLDAARQIALIGAGPGATTIISAVTSGAMWILRQHDGANALNISGMQLDPAQAGGGTANGIPLVGNTAAGCPAFSSFRDITISGTATSYFATSVAISVWGNINFVNVNEQITGASVVGTGVEISSPSASQTPVVYDLRGGSFVQMAAGLVIGDYTQGVQVVGENFTGCAIGINAPAGGGGTGRDQLRIVNSQFGVPASGIGISVPGNDVSDIMTANNLFLLSDGSIGLKLNASPGRVNLSSNTFRKSAGTLGGKATGVQFSGTATTVHPTVNGNYQASDVGTLDAIDGNNVVGFVFTGAENEVAGGAGTIVPVVNVFNPVFPFVLINSDYFGPSSGETGRSPICRKMRRSVPRQPSKREREAAAQSRTLPNRRSRVYPSGLDCLDEPGQWGHGEQCRGRAYDRGGRAIDEVQVSSRHRKMVYVLRLLQRLSAHECMDPSSSSTVDLCFITST
jgi:hypothetical protein